MLIFYKLSLRLWRIFVFIYFLIDLPVIFFLVTFSCMHNLKTFFFKKTLQTSPHFHPDGRNSLQHVCTRGRRTGRALFWGAMLTIWVKITAANRRFNRSSRPLGLKTHPKAVKFTYHMHSIRKNKRPFQARFVRHHDHCAPLHAAASLPSFKTPFYIKEILRLQSYSFNSKDIYLSAQDVTVTCWMRMLCAAFTCGGKYRNLQD